VTLEEEVQDLLRSRGIVSPPGQLIEKKLEVDEIAFAREIVNAKGGTYVGARVPNKKAIDGFYRGSPAQLKEIKDATKVEKVLDAVVDAQKKASPYNSLAVFVRAPKLTRAQLLGWVPGSALPRITQQGIIQSVDVLLADGEWLRIAGGIVQ
jgi:hypothetical protein